MTKRYEKILGFLKDINESITAMYAENLVLKAMSLAAARKMAKDMGMPDYTVKLRDEWIERYKESAEIKDAISKHQQENLEFQKLAASILGTNEDLNLPEYVIEKLGKASKQERVFLIIAIAKTLEHDQGNFSGVSLGTMKALTEAEKLSLISRLADGFN